MVQVLGGVSLLAKRREREGNAGPQSSPGDGHRLPHLAACLAVAATVMAGACSGDDGEQEASQPPASKEPCEILTNKEILTTINVPPGGTLEMAPHNESIPDPETVVGMEWCDFGYVDENKKRNASYGGSIGLVSAFAEPTFRKWKDYNTEIDVNLQPVRGLGTEALWSPDNRTLTVLDDDHVVTVSLSAKTNPEESASTQLVRAKKLASKALRRI